MNTKNTTLTVPSGGNSGGAHTVGEVMELVDEYSYASRLLSDRDSHTRASVVAAITKLVSDRDVLLDAAMEFRKVTHRGGVALDAYIDAAIQKVQA